MAHSNAMFDHAKRTEMLTEVGGTVSELSGFPRLAYDMGMQAWQLAAYLINGAMTKLQDAGAFANTTGTEDTTK